MSELKKCPFCGGEAEISLLLGNYGVTCTHCMGAIFPGVGVTVEDAIKAWNTRKPMQNIVERLTGEMNHALDICNVGLARGFDKANEIVKEEGEINE